MRPAQTVPVILGILLMGIPHLGAQSVPEGGVSVIGTADPVDAMSFRAGNSGGQPIAARSVVQVDGQSFSRALRIEVTHPGTNFWDSALTRGSTVAAARDDVALFHAFVRKISSDDETGLVTLQVYVEGNSSYNYSKSLSTAISAGDEWTEIFLPFTFNDDYPTGSLSLNLGFGQTGKTMTMEIAGIELLNYAKTKTLNEMPRTAITYPGREADAPWRAEAATRIEQYRKGDLTIKVIDSDGNAVPDAAVSVEMLRHRFSFSTAVTAQLLTATGSDADTYRATILEYFNSVGTENDLKWPPWDGDWGSSFNRAQTLQALQWIQDNDLFVRGHVLVWPGENNLPNSIRNLLPSRDPSVPRRVLDHIDDITQATRDYVQEWDVINEPYDNRLLMDIYGDHVMVDWFEQARMNLPKADLYINDYSILSSRGRDTAHQQRLEDVVQYLVDQGAPITGIGFQGHFGDAPTEPTKLWEVLQRYSNAFPNLKFKVTEFDIGTEDREYQADYTRDFMTLVFSHPQMEGLQFWGFWEGRHWRPGSAMFNEDWTEKPFAAVYRDLVFNQWWTDLAGTSDSTGFFTGRTFFGRHLVTIEHDGLTSELEIDFAPGAGGIKVRLNTPPQSSPPPISRQPLSQRAEPGGTARFTVEAHDPDATYQWFHDGTPVGGNNPVLELVETSEDDAGTYWVDVTDGSGTVSSRRTLLAVKEPPYDGDRLINISTRGQVLTDAKIMIAGFVLAGTEPKESLLRAVGPTLGGFGVANALADPVLDLVAFIPGGEQSIGSNEAWDVGQDAILIEETSTRVGAFELEPGSRDAVIHASLDPGAYTAKVSGKDNQTGVSLVEVYDADEPSGGLVLGKVTNISTRGEVGTGTQVLIAGFVVTGDAPKQVLIRGIGPGLAAFGVPGTLLDPELTLLKKLPDQTEEAVARNDDWSLAPDPDALATAASSVGAFALDEGSWDSALLVWLEPGVYTARMAEANSGTGVGLIEVYAVD